MRGARELDRPVALAVEGLCFALAEASLAHALKVVRVAGDAGDPGLGCSRRTARTLRRWRTVILHAWRLTSPNALVEEKCT